MTGTTRRTFLTGLSVGASLTTVGPSRWLSHGPKQDAGGDPTPSLSKLGQSLLGAPPVEYAEGAVSNDGRYAAVGSWNDEVYGSFLVDLADPANPERSHFLESPHRVMNMDVKFGPREGLYYRAQQPIDDQAIAGVEIVDFGYAQGSPGEPVVIGRLESGSTHNLFPHPEEPFVYAVIHDQKPETKEIDIWDVSDPAEPEHRGPVGVEWSPHDVTVDPGRELLHCAYGKGYVVMDASDPATPTELGRFAYGDHPSYEEVGLGNEGFSDGHFARADPRRDLVVMGDEASTGVPGGKHVFDIGWDQGSPEEPVPIGFTTSPNAQLQVPEDDQDEGDVILDWTGHNFDIVPWDDATLLVSGDWHEGIVLYDFTDPRNPTPIDRYATDDRADETPGELRWGSPPMAWSAVYNEERDLVVVSDVETGLYTFRIDSESPGTAIGGSATPGSETEADGTETATNDDADWWWLDWDVDIDWDFGLGWDLGL